MASAAEWRLREKSENLLREIYPEGRLVHEFAIGGVRLDLAMLTPDRIVTVEIKSELDTLDRLANQLTQAVALGGEVWLVYAPKWRDAINARSEPQDMTSPIRRDGYTTFAPNPLYIRDLTRCVELTEDAETGALVTPSQYGLHPRDKAKNPGRYLMRDSYNSRLLLGLLLKPELFALAKPHGGKSRHDVTTLQDLAHEHLTGRQIRRSVLAALRARRFGWTCDAPVTTQASTVS